MTDVYAIGIAGWAEQDVFVKEVDGALAALERSLPINGRSLRLINNAETVEAVPLASQPEFCRGGAGGRADDEQERGRTAPVHDLARQPAAASACRYRAAARPCWSAQDVKASLDKEGIKNRVVIVSACFGGVFTCRRWPARIRSF